MAGGPRPAGDAPARARLGSRLLARLVMASPVAPRASWVERAARAYARLGGSGGALPRFRDADGLAARLERLVGRPAAELCPRLHEDWFALKLLNWLDELRPLSVAGGRDPAPELTGGEHLRRALAGGGALLVTAHFGFPPAIRPLLASLGVRPIAVRGPSRWEEGPRVGSDPWTRARALRRLEAALEAGRTCVILADGQFGATIRVPLLRQTLDVGIGAFALALRTGCPLLPFFVVRPHERRAFRLDVLPPLARPAAEDGEPMRALARAFAEALGRHVEAYPCHVYNLGGFASARSPA